MLMKTNTLIRCSGTSARTLRYYEQKGILHPRRDERNTYRYYGESDLISLWEAKSLSELGLRLSDIERHQSEDKVEPILFRLDRLQTDLTRKIEEYERKLQVVVSTRHRYEQYAAAGNGIVPYSYQNIYRLFLPEDPEHTDARFDCVMKQWADALPFTKINAVIDHRALTGNPDHRLPVRLGLGISQKHAMEQNLPLDPPVLRYPRVSGIMTAVSLGDPGCICERDLEPLLAYIRQNDLEIVGDFHARLAYISNTTGEAPSYHFFLHAATI